jgi:hypothetical protein
MENLQLTQEELLEMVSSIQKACNDAIVEGNLNNEYTLKQKESHELHWTGVSQGVEVLYKNILLTIKYKNLAVSE